jgi:predicted acylesterase/phospholipase RssA
MAAARKVGLSLSGGGHLLPYYLGVGQTLLEAAKSESFPRIYAVSGSSAGAIAAVIISKAPDLIRDYANRFIEERGNALQNLKSYVSRGTASSAHLYICTTKCRDGSVHLFDADRLESEAELLECVRASCTVPRTFHPYDVLAGGELSYPDSDGILIRGEYHVDGGIAGPAPPVLNCTDVIIVSPISGSSKSHRISPTDTSFAFWRELKCRGELDFYVRPSIQNLKALRMASPSTTSQELQALYEQGINDANGFLQDWDK